MLKVVICGNIFVIGNLDDGNRLQNPRQVFFIDGETAKPDGTKEPTLLVRMIPLPGLPLFFRVNSNMQSYDINPNDTSTINLYNKLTAPVH
jgi:hypothetical protein